MKSRKRRWARWEIDKECPERACMTAPIERLRRVDLISGTPFACLFDRSYQQMLITATTLGHSHQSILWGDFHFNGPANYVETVQEVATMSAKAILDNDLVEDGSRCLGYKGRAVPPGTLRRTYEWMAETAFSEQSPSELRALWLMEGCFLWGPEAAVPALKDIPEVVDWTCNNRGGKSDWDYKPAVKGWILKNLPNKSYLSLLNRYF